MTELCREGRGTALNILRQAGTVENPVTSHISDSTMQDIGQPTPNFRPTPGNSAERNRLDRC